MGFFDSLFEKKRCSICNNEIDHFTGKRINDGVLCQNCVSKLSPWFFNINNTCVNNIKYQLYYRNENIKKLRSFHPTRTIGTKFKVLIDEDRNEFTVALDGDYHNHRTDIISCDHITECQIDIKDKKEEVSYKDSHGNTHSFAPPYYAYSYDIYVKIKVDIPYINSIEIKLNDKPIDNDQPLLINMGSDNIFGMFVDIFSPAKSYNGKNSNASEVIASADYKKYESMAEEIKYYLEHGKNEIRNKRHREQMMIRCPWCESKVSRENENCPHCGGAL